MKRAIVVSVRTSIDQKTNENVVWVSCAVMPSKGNNGKIYYPKSTDIVVTTCAGELSKPDNYGKYSSLKIGDIVDISYGFNEFTQKPFVENLLFFKSSGIKESELIV